MQTPLAERIRNVITPSRLSRWKWAALGLVAIYIIVFSVASIRKHEAIRSTLFDLALFEQILWNLSRGHGYTSSVGGFSFLGNHLSFTLILLAPIYRVFTNTWTLLIAQTVIMGSGGIAAFDFARRKLEDEKLALAATAVYLSLLVLGYTNLFDCHVEPLAGAALMFALNAMDQRQWRRTMLLLGIALLSKEEVALVVAIFGLYIAFEGKQWALGIGTTAVSLLYFVMGVHWLLPYFGGYSTSFTGNLTRYAHLGGSFAEIARTTITRPFYALSASYAPDKLGALIALLGSLAFLPLLGFYYLPLALPILAINYLSGSTTQFNLHFQYLTLAVPGLFASMVCGLVVLRRLLKTLPREVFSWIATVGLVACAGFGVYSQIRYHSKAGTFVEHPHAEAVREALLLIPPDASASATNYTAPHLAARQELYLSVPMLYDIGTWLPQYPDTDYILLSEGDVFSRPEDVARRIGELSVSPDYRSAFARDGVHVFCRISVCGR